MSPQTSALAVVAAFTAQPGKEEELGRRLLALVAPTRREAGSLLYHICRLDEQPAQWVVLENWLDRAAFDAHMRTPYVSDFMAAVPALCDGAPQLAFYALQSPAYPAAA